MNSGGGVRPNKLWHWFAVAFLVATFLAEPQAFMALTWQLFRGAGAVGGELLTGDPEPDVLNLQPQSDTEAQPNDGEPGPDGGSIEGDTFNSSTQTGDVVIGIEGDDIRRVLDQGVEGVGYIHGRVQQVQQQGGLTVEIGGQS